tara:strand:+ start:779 stop:1477 length:699 start_codon:yes stop_codon:yes gene_type:complete
MISKLKKNVLRANKELGKSGLVKLTWGNISEIDRKSGLIAIKPSGVDYKKLKLDDIVITNLDGEKISSKLKPSSDLLTHVEIYKSFPKIGGICHTHSKYATIFCQAQKSINCIGTTHADHFLGKIPVTRRLKNQEINNNQDYVINTGKIILEKFKNSKIDYQKTPAILVANHAPFTWGKNAIDALQNSIVLEEVAEMEFKSYILRKNINIEKKLLKLHFKRKSGPNKSYGQN